MVRLYANWVQRKLGVPLTWGWTLVLCIALI